MVRNKQAELAGLENPRFSRNRPEPAGEHA